VIHILTTALGDYDLYGSNSGNDTLTGTVDYGSLYGYAGNDLFVADASNVYMFGGTGNDTYSLTAGTGNGSEVIAQTGEGTNTIDLHDVDPSNVELATDSSGNLYVQYDSNDYVEIAAGLASNSGSTANQYVQNITFDDGTTWNIAAGASLTTFAGDYNLYGMSSGNDTLTVTNGYANVYAYGDNNEIVTEATNDTLYGGNSATDFVFQGAQAYNANATIADFSLVKGDKIDLSPLLSAYTPGTSTLADFVQAVPDGAGDTVLQVDSTGSGTHFQTVATLTGVSTVNVNSYVSSGNLIV